MNLYKATIFWDNGYSENGVKDIYAWAPDVATIEHMCYQMMLENYDSSCRLLSVTLAKSDGILFDAAGVMFNGNH